MKKTLAKYGKQELPARETAPLKFRITPPPLRKSLKIN